MSIIQVKLLVVEDSAIDRRLLEEYLTDQPDMEFSYDCVANLADALDRLKTNEYDVLILDLSLPDSNGLDTFYSINSQHPNIPTVILTGLNDEKVAMKAVQEGAHEYMVKGKIDAKLLIRSIRYAMKRQQARARIQSRLNKIHDMDSADSSGSKLSTTNASSQPVKQGFDELLRDYEALLENLISNKLSKNTEIVSQIRNFAAKSHDSSYTPSDLYKLAQSQKILGADHYLLVLLNIDIASEMVAKVYQEAYNVVLRG